MNSSLAKALGRLLALGTLCLCHPLLREGSDSEIPKPSRHSFRQNTTAHLVFNTVSSLLQHWPNTIYRNGHTFVSATLPAGTVLYHGRPDYRMPPSPEWFAFDFDHAYLFSIGDPCVVLKYRARHDLRVGYFDGTSAARLRGPRDFQDILFNSEFIPPEEYNPWTHARSMCTWAREVGLDGVIRMEPSFEAILCNIESDLELVTQLELVYPQIPLLVRPPSGPKSNTSDPSGELERYITHSRSHLLSFPGPTIPYQPPPTGWMGTQRSVADVMFEAVRAGMWHNRWPGETRIQLDYSSIVSAYDEEYTSLVEGRRGSPRAQHRLSKISARDKEHLKSNVHDVLSRPYTPTVASWPTLFQGVTDQYAERLETLRYILRHSQLSPPETIAVARQMVLVMLTPFMVLPRVKIHPDPNARRPSGAQTPLADMRPSDDWISRIYQACSLSAAAGIPPYDELTKQEKLLAKSINGVQGEICSTLTKIWTTAFDSEDKPVLAQTLLAEWSAEIEELMEWLDWHVWVKCDPPCGPGLSCTLTTWPWEVWTDETPAVPTCRNRMLFM